MESLQVQGQLFIWSDDQDDKKSKIVNNSSDEMRRDMSTQVSNS